MKRRNPIQFVLILVPIVCLINQVCSQNLALANHTSPVWSVRFVEGSNGDRYLVSGSEDSKINFWSQSNSGWSLKGQINNAYTQYMASIGNQLATVSGSNIRVWNVSTRTLNRTYPFNTSIMELAVSPSQSLLAAGTGNISQVLNLTSGLLMSTTCCHSENVRSLVFYSEEILVTGISLNDLNLCERR